MSADYTGRLLTREVMATADIFLRESRRLFKPHGLTAAQYNVLNALAAAPAGLSQRELGDVLVVDRSNVTGLIDRLETTGWVRRTADPSDRRVHRLALTPAGRRLRNRVHARYDAVVQQVVAGLDAPRMHTAVQVLKSLQAGARAWHLPKA